MQIEILAALVQVTPPSEDQKEREVISSPLFTEDYNASQKIMNSVEDDPEILSSLSVNDDCSEEEIFVRHQSSINTFS